MLNNAWGIQPPINHSCSSLNTSLGQLNISFATVNRLTPTLQQAQTVLGYAERHLEEAYDAKRQLESTNLRERVIVSINPTDGREIRLTRIYYHAHPNKTRYRQLGQNLADHTHQESTLLRFKQPLIENQINLIKSILQYRGNETLFQLVEKNWQTPAERFRSLLYQHQINPSFLYSQYTAINAFPQRNNTALLEGVQFSHGDQLQLTGTKHIAITKYPHDTLLLDIMGSFNLNPRSASEEFTGKYALETGVLSGLTGEAKNLCHITFKSIQRSVEELERHFISLLK
jgi:hypothetical protein